MQQTTPASLYTRLGRLIMRCRTSCFRDVRRCFESGYWVQYANGSNEAQGRYSVGNWPISVGSITEATVHELMSRGE